MQKNNNYYNGFKLSYTSTGVFIETRTGRLYQPNKEYAEKLIDYWKEIGKTINYIKGFSDNFK